MRYGEPRQYPCGVQAYKLMNLEFRPVDCYTKQPLIYLPGYINETIYSNQVESGWSWNAYQTTNKQLEVGFVV